MTLSVAALGVRWILALVLVTAALTKFAPNGSQRTVEAVANYGAVPRRLHRAIGTMLPWAELLLAGLFVAGVAIELAAVATALMLGTFTTAMAWHVRRGRRFACGCGGDRPISWGLVRRNIILCALALSVAASPGSPLAVWPGPGQALIATPFALALPMPLIAIVLLLALRLLAPYLAGRTPSLGRAGAF
jgi:uncharacterized membrane protein YphA (DoxX/SURF4 family)